MSGWSDRHPFSADITFDGSPVLRAVRAVVRDRD